MKKWITLLFIISILALTACGESDDRMQIGLNAEILEIDTENQILYVKGLAPHSDELLGKRCAIDCSKVIENGDIIYVNYENTDDILRIEFDDLLVGDSLMLTLYESELEGESVTVEQIQLGTQRLN